MELTTTQFGDKTPEQVARRVDQVIQDLGRLSHQLSEAIRPSWKCCDLCCPADYHPYAGMHKEPCEHWKAANGTDTAGGKTPN